MFTPKLIWTQAQMSLASQSSKAMMAIHRYQRTLGDISCKDLFKIFDSIVTPILCYGSEIWGYNYCKIIEDVHVKMCKSLLKVSKYTCNAMVLGECGRAPLQLTYMTRAVSFWCRLIQMGPERLPYHCYRMLTALDDMGRTCYATNIKNILYRFGFGYVWISQDVGDKNIFLSMFKQRLFDNLQQTWSVNVHNLPDSYSYKQYKSLLTVEYYLNSSLPSHLKRILSHFRCSNFRIAANTGRHQAIPYQERLCPLCLSKNKYFIENEYHVLLICEAYSSFRNTLIGKYIKSTS